MEKSQRTKGKEGIDRKIEESLLIDQEQGEWPSEKFRKLLEALSKTSKDSSSAINSDLPISIIETGENIRRSVSESELQNLASDIESNGLIHPPVVTVVENESGYKFQAIAGHRRIAALRLLNRRRTPVIIHSYQDISSRLKASFSENLKRSEMDVFDLAYAFKKLQDNGISTAEISANWDFERTTIYKYLKFVDWGDDLVTYARTYKEKLPIRFLSTLNARKSDEEKMTCMQEKVAGKKPEKKSSSSQDQNYKKICSSISKRKLTQKELALISSVLMDSKIISKELTV